MKNLELIGANWDQMMGAHKASVDAMSALDSALDAFLAGLTEDETEHDHDAHGEMHSRLTRIRSAQAIIVDELEHLDEMFKAERNRQYLDYMDGD